MNDKIKNIFDAIEIQGKIMRECQHRIRQAEKTLEENKKDYRRSMEEKMHLQNKLIEEMMKMGTLKQQEKIEVISQTEAAKLLNKNKSDVHQMILEGRLKNYGNSSRFLVNKHEVLGMVTT